MTDIQKKKLNGVLLIRGGAIDISIPAFSPQRREWQGDWQGIFFLQAPKQDKNFRFLRRLLIGAFAVPISRGIFFYPGNLPEKITFELNSSYVGAVTVVQFKKWSFGDERQLRDLFFEAMITGSSGNVKAYFTKNSPVKGHDAKFAG